MGVVIIVYIYIYSNLFVHRVALEDEHILKTGLRHFPSPAATKVIETRRKIQESIEADPLSFVTVIYEKVVSEMRNEIRLTG